MRSVSISIALLFAVLANPSALAGQIGVAGGPSVAVGDMAEVTSLGFHAGVVANIGVPALPVPLRADLMFQTFPAAEDDDEEGHARNQVFGTLNARLAVFPPLQRMYVSGGAGVYADTEDWSTNLGINLGGGLELDVGPLRTFAEVRYHMGFGSQATSFIPITLGVLF